MSFFGFKLDLNPTFGAYVIGTFVSNILLGASCVQTYVYFREYDDQILVWGTVLLLLVVEMVHGALSMHVIYHYLIGSFANPLGLLRDVWSVNIGFFFTAVIVLVVQLCYATRIYIISRRLIIPVLVIIPSFANFSLGCALTAVLFRNSLISSMVGTPDNIAKAILIMGAFVDLVVAAVLSYYLNRARTGIKQTDKIIDKLMMYAINNGIITSVVHIASVVLVFTHPTELYSLAVSQVVGNLYSNSLMATLNSRPRHKSASPAHSNALEVASNPLATFRAADNPVGQQLTRTSTSTDTRSVDLGRGKTYGQIA